MSLSQHQTEIATGVTYAASSGAILFGTLTIHDWAAITGIVVAIATYFTMLYFKITDRKHNLRGKKRRQ